MSGRPRNWRTASRHRGARGAAITSMSGPSRHTSAPAPVEHESHFDRIKARLLARSPEVRSVPGGIERDGNATSSGVTFGAESNPVPPRLGRR